MNRQIKWTALAMCFVLLLLTGCSGGTSGGDETELLSGYYTVEIDIRDYGVIKLELDANTAPITVTNFVNLAESGFYDGLTFHRIMLGVMMQGGDPDGNGGGGSGVNIKGEFSANGVTNTISHQRGVISMARATPYDSASSQFFICQEDASRSLDGQYAAFGYVTEGMEVVDAVCHEAKPTDDNGTIPASQQPVINTIRVTGHSDTPSGVNVGPITEDTWSSPDDSGTSGGQSGSDSGQESDAQPVLEEPELLSGLHHVEIEVKDFGVIRLELDADAAPLTVSNFVDLARRGFYDGLTFHRILSGFMIQGGSPSGDSSGGSGRTVRGEFSANGVENPILHVRGVISMARARAADSATSQFFICHADAPHLDGSYAAFGHVTEGMEVVDAICETVQPTGADGAVEKSAQPVIVTIRVID